jgi:carboxynorspermidine decarboxylase
MQHNERMDLLREADLDTPAFVFDVSTLQADAQAVRRAMADEDTRVLFAMKSFSLSAGLKTLAGEVDGFAASSLFEARLARQILRPHQTVHLTTPGLRTGEMPMLCELTDYVSFNSLAQWLRFRERTASHLNCGLRVNPGLSFVDDARYDPCRENSKLGIHLADLSALLRQAPQELRGIRGIHFHSNCDSQDLAPLLATVERLLDELDPLFDQIEWVNLGGGYLFSTPVNKPSLMRAKARLRERGPFQLFTEPGASMVRRAGNVVTSVVDLFQSGDSQVAVLDTSTNHMPEVFEYQFEPNVWGDSESGENEYLLAGSACLAGDVFGRYGFDEPLRIGARVIFPDMGAYSLVKANMFNGINLPTIYALNVDGTLEEVKRFAYEDYLTLCGG